MGVIALEACLTRRSIMEVAARRLAEIVDDFATLGVIIELCPKARRFEYVRNCARLMPRDAVDKLSSFSVAYGNSSLMEAVELGIRERSAA